MALWATCQALLPAGEEAAAQGNGHAPTQPPAPEVGQGEGDVQRAVLAAAQAAIQQAVTAGPYGSGGGGGGSAHHHEFTLATESR
jgi:hypothetical protein